MALYSTYDDVVDALTLAFYNNDFEEAEVEGSPIKPAQGKQWVNFQMRRKTALDDRNNSPVLITQIQFDEVNNAGNIASDRIEINWRGIDERAYFDVTNRRFWSYRTNAKGEKETYFLNFDEARVQRVRVKMALGAITDFYEQN